MCLADDLNKHQQKTELTQQKLLKAARRVFARDGFEAARIDDVATEAGYTRGAFYAHFKSKEAVFLSLLEQQANLHVRKIRLLMENCNTEAERLNALREYYVGRVGDRQWSILVLEFKLYALRHVKTRAKLAQAHRRIRTQIKLEALEPMLPCAMQSNTESKELRRIALEGLLHGLVLEHAYDAVNISEDQVASMLREFFDLLIR